MKNILLGSIFVLVFLPQVSFGANQTPIVTNHPSVGISQPSLNQGAVGGNNQLTASDQAAVAMYQQQAAARAAYIKLHHDEIVQQDQDAVAMYKQQAAARAAYIKLHQDEIAQRDKAAVAMYHQQAAARAQANQNSSNP